MQKETNLNVVLYSKGFLPKIGGREMVVFQLARALRRLGTRVRVVCPSGWRTSRRHRYNFPVHRWPTLRGLFPEQVAYAQLSLDVSIWGADVIHAHNTYPTGYIGTRFNKRRSTPLVITPHGRDIHVIPEIDHGLRLDPELKPKIEHAVREANLVTAISDSVRDSLVDAGAHEERIRQIPNGIDFDRFRRTHSSEVLESFGLPADAKLLLTVGSYEPRRGHENLIRAMPQIKAAHTDARLVIVGRSTHQLQPLIDELGLNEDVILTGEINFPTDVMSQDDPLAAIYQASSIYLSGGMAEGAEGLSLAVLDAMAAGLPVVATNISGNRDIVSPGKNGYLVEPGDIDALAERVIRLLRDEAVSRQLGQAATDSVRKYGWDEIANQYLDLYNEAITLARNKV
ncbi:MAG: glycosyltransferase family 4 protein [Gammaproteobacteria bacterium]